MIPTNTYTVAIADTHAHSISQSGIPAQNKLDAINSVIDEALNARTLGTGSPYAAFVETDTWTVTITQP